MRDVLGLTDKPGVGPRAFRPYWMLRDCPICGASIGPCLNWPWHLATEDCRAIRRPVGA